MVWWIAGGVVVVALVALLVALAVTFASLRRFAGTAMSLNRRLADGAERLQPRMADLQGNAEAMQGTLLTIQERSEALVAKRAAKR